MTDRKLGVHLQQTDPIPLDARLECAPGEVLALVGPSGSGKTTILRAIAGLLGVAKGYITCGGEIWLDTGRRIRTSPQQRRIGMVFQHYALFPHLTALQNVMESVSDLPPARRFARASEWLAKVHLAGLEDRLPAALSGGQQQRVALARALAREPRALLLDEPFSAVDRATRERLYRELAELRRDLEMPVVLVTHDLGEAAMLADRMCVLSRGRTLQAGRPIDVVTQPESVEVAQLVGLKNVFRAGVVRHEAAQGVTIIEWRGRRLEARLQSRFQPGSQVAWVIPEGHIVLHRRDRPSRGERENPVHGVVASFVPLGENAMLAVDVGGNGRPPLFFSVSLHVARRNGIERGVPISVSLLAEGIHLMPADRERSPRQRAGIDKAGVGDARAGPARPAAGNE